MIEYANDTKIISPNEFAERMKELEQKYYYDIEVCHSKMDKLLIETLKSLGYEEGVKIFDGADKWYS